MSAGAVTFTDAIRAYARNNSIDLPADHVGVLDSVLKSLGKIEDGQISFVMSEGKAGTFEDIMARETEGVPRIRAQKAEPIPVAAGSSATARALEKNAALRSPAKIAQAQALADAHGNPWSPRSINRTHQAAITKFNPQLAATLKAQAGV